MNREELILEFDNYVSRMRETLVNKNHDYSGDNSPFHNFEVVEKVGICSAEQGFLTRMMDKMMRINNFVASGVLKVQDEKIEDTLLDLANYSLLLSSFIKYKKENK